ncbi:hypothetical protein PQ478_10865 [Alkalihalophilus pseudofirmus]|uniref:hypothetical protein n=1 Tax=Alkalihalophilus pseudofirmus TaxID=79885 RepID=UPI00259BD47A|nr:hypothetical protein [Alkalihalophilus pseudofirmus]WEG18957.1 hypothetical protein PQ478_10865 [Alkalihalophilus pseudofirmus]
MLKQAMRFSFMYFVIMSLVQYFLDKEMRWIENLTIGFIVFILMSFINWCRVPYNWDKKN